MTVQPATLFALQRAAISLVLCATLLPIPLAHAAGSEPFTNSIHATESYASASLRWNWEARDIVRRNRVDPLWATRTYAMVSVAQYRAAQAVEASKDVDARNQFTTTAIAASAATLLAHLYPHEVPRISGAFRIHVLSLGDSIAASEKTLARSLGATAALEVLKERETDGATSLEDGAPPAGLDVWYSSEDWAPMRTYWGHVRPFLAPRLDDFGAPPPPPLNSGQFRSAIEVVREARGTASGDSDRIARKWADGPGTVTPPGHWNQIAARLIAMYDLGELESARILALLNMALMDVGIVCWRDKYTYWLRRPSQVDPRIVTSFPLPNFPSYPSGHAAFSGAASAFLAHRFPDQSDELNRAAEEAALSRVVSGIHYPFDSAAGLEQGRRVARLAIARYSNEGAQFTAPATTMPAVNGGSR